MDFIFMLTRNDRTVVDCLEVLESVSSLGLKHIGFKDVGVPTKTLKALTTAIKDMGATSYLEVVSETPEARHVGWWLAQLLGLEPFDLPDDARPLYHAGAAIASNYVVTLHRVASELFEAAGAPSAALAPLMRRTIDNGFELTGPISRGDWATVERHREAIRGSRPELEALYDVLAEATTP